MQNDMTVTPAEKPVSEMAGDQVEQERLTDWAKEPTITLLKGDFELAQQNGRDHIRKIKEWRDMRNVTGKHRPKKVQNRSSVQPKLIRRQNEWRYSALSEPFLSSDKMYDVDPVTWEDKKSAEQNELLLNWQWRTKINAVKFIDEYVRTDVDEGTVIVRLGWVRESEEVMKDVPILNYYPLTTPEEQAMFQEALDLKENNPNEYLNLPEMVQYAVDYFEETGVPNVAEPTGEVQQIPEMVVKKNQPSIQICNNENIYIDPSCEGDIEKARFIVYTYETSKAELLADKRYKNINAVNWQGSDILSQPDHVTDTPDAFQFKDELRKRVVAYEYWGLADIDGTGKMVPIVATWIGNTLIRMEKNPFPDEKPPFVVVPYMPIIRSVMGETDAELLEDNQKILGAVTRGMIDLLGRSANGQTGTAKGMLDNVNKRRFDQGQNYEFNPGANPQGNFVEHKFPELSQSSLTMLQLQNQEAEALTGVKSFSGGISGDAYGDVAAGIRGMLDAAAKREMAILRRLAQGIKEIGAKMVSMNQVFLSEEEVVRVTNSEFVKIRREDLQGRFDLKVDISTAEVDDAKSQDLSFMLQTIGPNMEFGIMKMIMGQIAELKRMPVLAQMIKEYEPQPDPLEERAKELEIEKLEMQVAELRSKAILNEAKARGEHSDADKTDLDFVEQETGTAHERELAKQQAQAEGNKELEVTKALLRPSKPEEKEPDVEAAVGYNELSGNRTPLATRTPSVDPTAGGYVQNPVQPIAGQALSGADRVDPSQNIGSKYHDASQDPALNPALNL